MTITYEWTEDGHSQTFTVVHVGGTNGEPFRFGTSRHRALREVGDFWIATTPVTQALWSAVMAGSANPSDHRGAQLPLENVSWDEVVAPGGLLDRLNSADVRERLLGGRAGELGRFRLPTETEWEYAARGGPSWRDGYRYSGSNDPDAVAWYDRKHGDHTEPVASKAPNQLGLYDMSGNVWEWCADRYSPDVARASHVPEVGLEDDRVLRGGCFHNFAEHCTVSKRYHIGRAYRDGCIGVRLVLSNTPD